MGKLDSTAQRIVVQSHSIKVRAVAYGPYGTRPIPVSGGEVTSDTGSQVRRTATVNTSVTLWPVDPRSVIGVNGTEIQVDYGIVIPGVDDPLWVPMIRGLLTKTSRERPIPSTGVLPLQLVDRSARVAEDRFEAPTQTVAGALTTAEIRRLIQETLGTSVLVSDLTGSAQLAQRLDIARERWDEGVEPLADSIAAECYADPVGNFVIRPQPQLTDAAVWTISSGRGGNLIKRGDELSREGVYSGVVVSGERTDGTAPVTATVWDTDPASPTYYLGPFGKKLRFYSSPLLTTVPQCQATGAALLGRSKGNSQPALVAIPNPALEGGDVIILRDLGLVTTHIIDKVVTPLSPSGLQTIHTRAVA
jgi:hypothetical protein